MQSSSIKPIINTQKKKRLKDPNNSDLQLLIFIGFKGECVI